MPPSRDPLAGLDVDPEDSGEITRLLGELREGDSAALERLFERVYAELRREAHRRRRLRRRGETLTTTALVHETYLKLAGAGVKDWRNRGHFFAVAAKAMRQILIDDARKRTAQKRGLGETPITLDDVDLAFETPAEDLLALDAALEALAAADERLARMVELRFFAGLSVEETALAMGVSDRTVKRDWRKARALLHWHLGKGPLEDEP